MIDDFGYELPDGSGVAFGSMPLPKDHWLTAPACELWDLIRGEMSDCPVPILTRELESRVKEAARYAVRAATRCGKEMDFDPDAMVQDIVYALCGPAATPAIRVMASAREVK